MINCSMINCRYAKYADLAEFWIDPSRQLCA